MRRVIIESPYAAGRGFSIEQNIEYAKRCVRERVLKGDAPLASHLLFTRSGILRDEYPDERKLGIDAGLAWTPFADCSIFFVDHGWSSGMLAALHRCFQFGYKFELRKFGPRWQIPATLDEDVEAKIRANCIED